MKLNKFYIKSMMLSVLFALYININIYAESEPNDNAVSANALSLNGSDNGNLTSPDDNDWWKVTTVTDGKLIISTSSDVTGCFILYLYDQDMGYEIINNYAVSCSIFDKSVEYSLKAGYTYYIKANRYSGYGNYTITSQFITSSYSNDVTPNETANDAQPLGLTDNSTGYLGAFGNGTTDVDDWWKVTTTNDGKLKVTTTSDSTLCAILYLYDQNMSSEIINNYALYCSQYTKSIEYSLKANYTYYIKVNRFSGYGGYSIETEYKESSYSNDITPNETANDAQLLGLNDNSSGYLGAFGNGATDMDDWWKVTTTTDGKLKVTTTSDSTLCAIMYLYDQNMSSEIVNNYALYCSQYTKSIEYSLKANYTYYFKANRYSGYGGYSITTQFIPSSYANDTVSNETANDAQPLGLNDNSSGYLGAFGNGATDMDDWWKVTTTTDGKLTVTTTSDSTLCAIMYLYDQNMSSEIVNNYALYCSQYTKSIEYSLKADYTYYIKTNRYSGYGGYVITTHFIPALWPNDTASNEISQNSQALTMEETSTGYLGAFGDGTIDWNDWWKVTTTEYGQIKVTVMSDYNMPLCADLYLYNQDTISELANTYAISCNIHKKDVKYVLNPGTYFIRANRYSGYGSYKITPHMMFKPIADFTYVQTVNTFGFTDSSTYGETYSWNFGDGNTGTGANPSHTYEDPGAYNVCVIASNPLGSDTMCKTVDVKGIRLVVDNKGGNTGDATISVYGGGFKPGSTFKLSRSGYPDITGDTVLSPSPGVLQATFDLRTQQTGAWGVVVEVPSDTSMTLAGGFTIEQGVPAEPWVDIVGRDRILFNRWQTYTITYGNNANVDASGVPLWLVITNEPGVEVEFVDFEIALPQVAIDSGWTIIKDSVPIYFEVDSLYGEAFKCRVYPLYIPIIPAGQTESVNIKIKTGQNIRVMAWMNPPYFQSPMSQEAKNCIMWAQAKALSGELISLIPGAGCVNSVVTNYIYDPWKYPKPGPEKKKTWGSTLWTLATTGLSCATNLFPVSAAAKYAITVAKLGAKIYNNYQADKSCKESFGNLSQKDKSITAVSSFDPNEKSGPDGYTVSNYTLKNAEFPYTIFFENKDSATAPAQEVFVTDSLDLSSFDITKFSFGPISFGDTVIYPLGGITEFTTDVDLNPDKNLIVRINAVLDTVTGVVKWAFVSLDPLTMALTEDPLGGFLPPNVVSPEGEGSVSFSAGLKSSLAHNDKIKNMASIVFDLNNPIVTNEWENTIDLVKPVSHMIALDPVINDTTFQIEWTGSDDGSGVKYYAVYYSENNNEYELWVSHTAATSISFTGKLGSTYKFYSIAEDSVGNIEDDKTSPEASTQLSIDDSKNLLSDALSIIPNPLTDISLVEYKVAEAGTVKVSLRDMFGKEIRVLVNEKKTTGKYSISLNAGDFESGIYFVILQTTKGIVTNKMTILR